MRIDSNKTPSSSFRVEQKNHSILFDVVQEMCGLVETFVSPRIKQVELEVECPKHVGKGLRDDVNESRGNLNTIRSIGSFRR